MRKALIVAALLLLPAGLYAQPPLDTQLISVNSTNSNCVLANTCASYGVGQSASLVLQVAGTFVGTLTFEGSADGGTWFTVMAIKVADLSTATTTTGTGQFAIGNVGLVNVRARATAWTSGTAVVSAARGYASAKVLTPFLSSLTFTNGTALSDPSGSGKLLITGTNPWIQLGGTSSSFPALKANGTILEARLADDSAGASFRANNIQVLASLQMGGSTVLLASATAPSAPSACGTSPAVTNNNGTAVWVITGGTGGTATGCTITLPTATNGWACSINNITGSAAHRADRTTVQTASTTTSVTWEYQAVSTGAASVFTASDVFRGICFAY